MRKNLLITGTLILTAAGFASRFIGFFYRIFLSRMFSAESMGIYELINPVFALTYALCISGIQNAISKFVASQTGPDSPRQRLHILLTGIIFSVILSSGCSSIVYQHSDFIAKDLLMEERCAPLLRIISLSFPAACIHSCINGYYYGIRKTGTPAICQLTEQLFRVGSVFGFWYYSLKNQITFTISAAAVGLVIGEMVSSVLSIFLTWLHFCKTPAHTANSEHSRFAFFNYTCDLFRFAVPLSLNRICLNFLSTIEAAWIPEKLEQFGYTNAEALSLYGALTGMAMTCIFFPAAITNSISVLIMPLIASADAAKNHTATGKILKKCISFCTLMGVLCMVLFLISGNLLGTMLFKNLTAGKFIRTLSLICPFMYLNSTLFSIQNGLGRTGLTFFCNLLALCIRLLFVFFTVPALGISGYFFGLFASQIFITFFHFYTLKEYLFSVKNSFQTM